VPISLLSGAVSPALCLCLVSDGPPPRSGCRRGRSAAWSTEASGSSSLKVCECAKCESILLLTIWLRLCSLLTAIEVGGVKVEEGASPVGGETAGRLGSTRDAHNRVDRGPKMAWRGLREVVEICWVEFALVSLPLPLLLQVAVAAEATHATKNQLKQVAGYLLRSRESSKAF
jgi:hypothetical protein